MNTIVRTGELLVINDPEDGVIAVLRALRDIDLDDVQERFANRRGIGRFHDWLIYDLNYADPEDYHVVTVGRGRE